MKKKCLTSVKCLETYLAPNSSLQICTSIIIISSSLHKTQDELGVSSLHFNPTENFRKSVTFLRAENEKIP